MTPKVFISYSWSSESHRGRIRDWAQRLAGDGVEIVLDQFELKEGQDKYAYMERMVTDKSVTHVLMFVDKRYAEKADDREAGVGAESQIISKEIYEKVDQSKFVPIVCEADGKGEPHLPVFLGSRIWLDFSSDEAVNKNWERLIRLLFGKPLYEKPQIGRPPAYITEQTDAPANPATGKFSVFRNAFLNEQKGIKAYRADFLDACTAYIDELRPRAKPEATSESQQWILENFRKLVPIRNLLTDWVLLEAESGFSEEFDNALTEYLERLLELKGRPQNVSSWSDWWYEAHKLFVFDTFLYIVAALLKVGAHRVLNSVLLGSYLAPEVMASRRGEFVSFAGFYGYTEIINSALTSEKLNYHSQAAELLKRSAERKDITFASIREADALAYVASVVRGEHWYPQTHYYWSYGERSPLFLRGSQRKHYAKLAVILGVESGDKLRNIFASQGGAAVNLGQRTSFATLVNLEKLDTIT